MSLFVELERKLALFRQITFMFHFALPNSGGVLLDPTFSSSGVSCLRRLALFRKIRIFSLRDGDQNNSTPFPQIAGAGQRDEDRLSQPTADTASFYFTEP